MTTIIPERTIEAAQGWVLYDGECSFCIAAITRLARTLRRHHFDLAPLQAPWVQKRIGLKPGAPLAEMKLLTDDGRVFGGADAWVAIARRIWWAWPLFAVAQIPGAMILLRVNYRWVAANRICVGKVCRLSARQLKQGGAKLPLYPFITNKTKSN